MSNPSVALGEPLFHNEPPRRGKAFLVFLLLMGSGCAVLWSQMPLINQESTIDMPLHIQPARTNRYPMHAMRPSVSRSHKPTTIQPAGNHQSKQQARWGSLSQVQPLSSISTFAKFPGTEVEIDATGVTFPIVAVCEVGEAGKACDGSTSSSGVCGKVTYTQTDAETCEIEYEINGLSTGLHGFHIHEKADFSNGCASAGPHYNPFKATHGGPSAETRHVGDLGNIEPGADGTAKGKLTDKFIKLFGEYSVVGRSMMIHADPDDLGEGPLDGWPEVPPPPAPAQHTKTTGNAGARIACGVIEVK